MKTPPLFKHQKKSLKLLAEQTRVFDMSDPGTGKTRVHIEDFARRRENKQGCALVLAPKSILQNAWGNDIEKFAGHLKYNVAYAENRVDAFEDQADLYITNIDAATWLAAQKPKFFKRFSHLIVDESTAFKHHTSKRSKALAKIREHFNTRRTLSGTPNPNGMTDLWHQVFLLDDGWRLGKSFFHFRSSVCIPTQIGPMPNHVHWEDREGAELAVTSLLKDITLRHVLEECLDMPENVEYAMDYYPSPKHLAYYLKLEADSILEIKSHKVTAVNGAVLYSKLLQAASGAVYDESGKYVVLDTGRYELIADLVEQRKHSLVFFNWAHQRDLLTAELEARKLPFAVIDGNTSKNDRAQIVKYFQKGFYRVVLIHPQSGAHGLTMTRATTTIWASPTANLEHFIQGNHRAYRAGQTLRTETIVIVARGTQDEKVYAAAQGKKINTAALLNELAA